MTAIKYSRQREFIKKYLASSKEHPTADMIYTHIREEFPHISLGTVYRNLALLTELGDIKKLTSTDGADRFDGNTEPHYHFICSECGSIIDLEMENIDHINVIAGAGFHGKIKGHITHFYGLCEACMKKQ